jgi:hypothetical protein
MRRRLFGLVAILALARLSFGGLLPSCSLASEPAGGHDAHSAIASIAPPYGHDGAPCEADGAPACNHTEQTGCAAMTSCAIAFEPRVWTPAPLFLSPGQSPTANATARRSPQLAPEPPPPRA